MVFGGHHGELVNGTGTLDLGGRGKPSGCTGCSAIPAVILLGWYAYTVAYELNRPLMSHFEAVLKSRLFGGPAVSKDEDIPARGSRTVAKNMIQE
jgi:hypothetical protein